MNVVTVVFVIGSWFTGMFVSGARNDVDHREMLIGRITAVYEIGYLAQYRVH